MSEDKNVTEKRNASEKKLPTEDAKNALKGALKGIPKSFLLKVINFINSC